MIKITCKHCGNSFTVKRLTGRIVCPYCGRLIKRGQNLKRGQNSIELLNNIEVIE